MEPSVAVDAPPASDWRGPRPDGSTPQLWADSRPTVETLAGLALPDGTVVHGAAGQLLGWESEPGATRGLADLWLKCARRFPSTGLWPVCDTERLAVERRWQGTDDRRTRWLDPYAVPSDVYDAANTPDRRYYFHDDGGSGFFRELMNDCGFEEADMKLARASTLPADPLGRLTTPENPDRLTLVACRRPADAVLLLDFGVANDAATPGIVTGVLRSWESRFGAVPVRLDAAWTSFQVIAPPTDPTQVERLAAEIFCFAVDSAIQGGFYLRTPDGPARASAQELARSHEWLIWWD